jgi:hypothetical protein
MAFIRSSEPFHEPPQRRPRWVSAAGVAALIVFFVPVLVVTAMGRNPAPAQATSTAGPLAPLPRFPPRIPPIPPPGAPWPPPPGAPAPPVCTLEYRVASDGTTTWTAMTTSAGTLVTTGSAASATGADARRHVQTVPVAVEPLVLPAPLARDHDLRAVLTSGARHISCLVGPQS